MSSEPEETPAENTQTAVSESSLLACSQILVSHLIVVNGFGYFSSFGIFQSHWIDTLGRSNSDISWVGSLSLFLLFFLGTLSGPIMDRGYLRHLLVAGCGFQILGVFTTSAVSQYWQLVLSQGIVQGIGNGLLFTPCIALVSTYFTKRRAFALSLAACGAPVGGVVFPIVSYELCTSHHDRDDGLTDADRTTVVAEDRISLGDPGDGLYYCIRLCPHRSAGPATAVQAYQGAVG